MDYSNVDYQSVIDLIKEFFDYITSSIFNSELHGLIMHMFSIFPAPIRSYVIVSLCALLFVAIIVNIKR